MTKGGLIIRLIDVVLILLLGFVGISDFTVKTQVKLPQGKSETDVQMKKCQAIIIRIDKDGKFELDDGNFKITGINDIKRVEDELVGFKKIHNDIIAIIEPDLDTIIQITVDLIDICERNNILKSINYEL